MRQEFDREIDALLRRTAARTAAGGVAPTAAASAQHLDADERAAFAENALPVAARAAYVAHLADCGECRRAVAALSAVTGAAVRLDAHEAEAAAARETEARGWRAWLSALFAPRSLRFVAPALALCLVGVVSYVVLRSADPEKMSARRAAETGSAAPAGGLINANTESSAGTTSNMNASVTTAVRPEEPGTAGPQANAAAPPPAPRADAGTAADAAPRTEGDTAREETTARTVADLPLLARQGESAPVTLAPPAAEARTEPKREENAAQENNYVAGATEAERSNNRLNQIRGIENQQMPDGARNQQRSSRAGAGGGTAAPPPPPAARESAKARTSPHVSNRHARGRQTDGTTADASDEAETRAVEGRRFRLQGGVWVDVNYKDTLPSTGVRRGTEAFRALVAELPELGRVAARLDGEVIIVARGRAYRIK